MREIKYKAFYRFEWYNVEELKITKSGKIHPTKFIDYDFIPDSEHVKCVVQYIELKDKNGKEIYDGDIVTHEAHETKSKIIFHEKYISFCGQDTYLDKYYFFQKMDEKNLEIIGNVYENSELLK